MAEASSGHWSAGIIVCLWKSRCSPNPPNDGNPPVKCTLWTLPHSQRVGTPQWDPHFTHTPSDSPNGSIQGPLAWLLAARPPEGGSVVGAGSVTVPFTCATRTKGSKWPEWTKTGPAFGIGMSCLKSPPSFPIKYPRTAAAGPPGTRVRWSRSCPVNCCLRLGNDRFPPAVASLTAKIIKFEIAVYIHIYIPHLPIAPGRANQMPCTHHAISHNYESYEGANEGKAGSFGAGYGGGDQRAERDPQAASDRGTPATVPLLPPPGKTAQGI